jgi:alanyl-tRNA synthetase
MTDRLYYLDAMAQAFDATVVACESDPRGAVVTLDRTAFYPTSGGQPFDTGRLGGVRVIDVIDAEDGDVRHVVESPIAPGAAVRGEIDWPRRFDHMQQHTGQHILSAAFDRRLGVRTVSFHLGADTSTIDLQREVTPEEIALAEADANDVVFADRLVSIRFASEDEAARLPLRKEPARAGRLRLVEIDQCDLSACGGTHVPSAGRVGLIAVAGWERFKGATRLTFVCGDRARRSHGRFRDVVIGAMRSLSVTAAEVGPAVDRVLAENKDAGRAVRRLQEEVAAGRAARLRAEAPTVGPYRVVLMAEAGWDAAALKTLAAAVVSEPGFVVVLVGDGQPVPVVVARSADVELDAGAWMKRATIELGGRGGGRPELAQGGITADGPRVLTFASQTLGNGQ